MQSFLQTLTADIYKKYGNSLSDMIIVFPNKRAGVFFNKYLSELVDQNIWLPEISTINELFQKESGLLIADPLTLNFKLYRHYTQLTSSAESFDKFQYWGEMLLNDFDDLDKYLINAKDMFQNLRSVKAIEDSFSYLTEEQINAIKQFWNAFSGEKLSAHQDEFIQIWEVLYKLYSDFRNDIAQEGIAYEGMAYRSIAEQIEQKNFGGFSGKPYIFAGFNALNKCEEVLFKYLSNIKNADFYWDFDYYYLNDPINEAGQFMRNNIKEFTFSNKHFDLNNLSGEKNLKLISSPTKTGQCMIASKILRQLHNSTGAEQNNAPNEEKPLVEKEQQVSNFTDTALVLADENLLMPALYALPDQVSAANVTMGYPLKITPSYSFIDSLLEMQKSEKGGSFYHKTVTAVLSHQFIVARFKADADELKKFINRTNAIYISPKQLGKNDFFTKLFTVPANSKLTHYLQEIVLAISESLKQESEDNSPYLLELESLYKVYTELNRIADVLAGDEVIITEKKTYLRIIRRVLNGLSVSFAGEPLTGLQVLGVLETRLVDFKNLIILSLNEGLFPKGKPAPSFIPYNIRSGFGIPTVKHQDAIFCYYFYRLLHRAKNVWMLYSTQTSDNSKGEMSRYVSQILYSGKFNIEQYNAEFAVQPETVPPISIEKTKEVQQILSQYLSGYGKRKLSPSAVNAYIDCPLRFYFRYIAGLNEPEQLTELLDEAQFGQLYHTSMELLFTPYIGKELSADFLSNMAKNTALLEENLTLAFAQVLYNGKENLKKEDIKGYNSVAFEIILKYLINSLKTDARSAPLKIHYLEYRMDSQLELAVGEKRFSVNLYGSADRIDETSDELRIIDYKTGNVNTTVTGGIESLFEPEKKRNNAALQTMMYSYVYANKHETPKPIVPAIFSIREQFMHSGYHLEISEQNNPRKKHPLKDFNQIKQSFEELLSTQLAELFDKNIAFTQTTNTDKCEYCSFKDICSR